MEKKVQKIFVLSGKAQSGKDTVANYIEEYYAEKSCIKLAFAYYLKDYLKRMGKYDEKNKPRRLMQEFGGQFLKPKLGDHFLIDRVLQDIEVFSYFYDILIITDARFVEEVESIKKNYDQVVTIRIIRDDYENGLSFEEKQDVTETDLDHYQNFDFIIQNDEQFEDHMRRCLACIK